MKRRTGMVGTERGINLSESGRMYALLGVAEADAAIVV